MATEKEFRTYHRTLPEQVRAHVPIAHLRTCMDEGLSTNEPLESYLAVSRRVQAELDSIWTGD